MGMSPELKTELKAITKEHECDHTKTELRRMIMKGGSGHYSMQCLRCGVSAKFVSAADVPNTAVIPEYDYGLKDAYRADLERKKTDARERHRMLRSSMPAFQEEYAEYLQTPEWRGRWRLVMERAKGMCEGCGKAKAQQVHHLTYEHVGNEFLWQLVAICHECHERVHRKD
jgi:5-methylcytosine-specific restriction endonuclease McrA